MTQLKDEDIYREKLPNLYDATIESAKHCCSVETAKKFVPIIDTLPKYKWKFLLADFVAGLTVGLTAIPQAIAYAAVAGLTAQYGLYSAFMGCFVYIIFGTCKDVAVGPTAILALMIEANASVSADYAILACFLSGIIIFLVGILNLGVLVQFISIPVTTGFTNAAAITIASSQLNSLFGISNSSNDFLDSWKNFFTHITETQRNDAILGVVTLIVLLLMRKIKDIPCKYTILTQYISMSRNALAVLVGSVLAYCLSNGDYLAFNVSGSIDPGLPSFKLPPFHTEVNGTEVSFGEMVEELGATLASLPLISVLESIAVAKSFSMGKTVDASQEMVALGIANILSSFVSSMPITGSFTRTAINNASGAKTTLSSVTNGVLVLLTLAFLTDIFYYIPKASLSAIIIAAMAATLELDTVAEIWRSKKMDMVPYLVTLFCCLFWTVEYGIVVGIVVNMLFILYKSARPTIVITKDKLRNTEVAVVDVQENLSYSSAEYLKTKVVKYVARHGQDIKIVVIRGEEIHSIDSTVALNILALKKDLSALNCELLCWNWQICSAGVVCRLHEDTREMFKFSEAILDILPAELQESSVITIPIDTTSAIPL